MKKFTKKWAIDAAERVGWTMAEALVAFGITQIPALELPAEATIILTPLLAALKVWIAGHIGNPDSASTVPEI